MNETTPPAPPPMEAPPTPAAPTAPAPTATRGDKLRIGLILGGIVVFLGVVLWMTRDNQLADDLAIGTCFDIPAADDFSTVTRHDCTAEHDAEVFHVAEYAGDTYPISLSLESFIDEECVPVFATYTGVDFGESEELSIGYFYPTRDAWDSGDRTVTCYVVRTDEGKLTQSVRAS